MEGWGWERGSCTDLLVGMDKAGGPRLPADAEVLMMALGEAIKPERIVRLFNEMIAAGLIEALGGKFFRLVEWDAGLGGEERERGTARVVALRRAEIQAEWSGKAEALSVIPDSTTLLPSGTPMGVTSYWGLTMHLPPRPVLSDLQAC